MRPSSGWIGEVEAHALCLYDCATGAHESSTLEHTPEAIAHWAATLAKRFPNGKIALCLEQAKGPLISALMAYPFLVLYPVNPATAARYRQAFKTSRAKSDPSDAQVCLELLLQHRAKLTPWRPDDPQTRQLARLLEHRRGTVDLRTLLCNMLRDALKSYYPQALDPGRSGSLCSTGLSVPPQVAFAPGTAKGEKRNGAQVLLRAQLPAHRSDQPTPRGDRVDDPAHQRPGSDRARQSPGQDAGSPVTPARGRAQRIRCAHRPTLRFPCRCRHLGKLPRGRPHARPTTLLLPSAAQRSRYQSAAAIQQYSGIAPVTERSGKNQHWVHRRWGRPHFVHQSFFEYANQSVLHCAWAKLFVQEQIAKGKKHPTAVRALAFKWQRIMFVCWRDRVAYDESTYLDSLKRRGSPLAAKLQLNLATAA